MTTDSDDLESSVRARLDEVLDPCSTFTDRPQSIVDLGLVDGVSIEGGAVTVELLPTNQLCTYVPHMVEDIENRVGDLPAVESVAVDQVTEKIWTQDRMTEQAHRERQAHFEQRVAEHDLTPAYDGEEWTEDARPDDAREIDTRD